MGVIDTIRNTFSKKQVDEITQIITTKTNESDLLKIINKWKGSQSKDITDAITVDWPRNYSYFMGVYSRDKLLKYAKSNIVVNHIFSSIKSVTPFVTSKPAEPVVYPRKYNIEEEKTEEAKKISLYAQEVIKKIYENAEIQKLNEANTINRYVYKIGVLRYGIKDNKIFTRLVEPVNLLFDCGAKQFCDQEYIGEKIKIPVDQLVEQFPKHKDFLLKKAQGKTDIRLEVIEWWTNESVITMYENEVLEVRDNPFISDNPILKYYDFAPIPFVALNVYSTGNRITDDVSEIDLTFKIQDAINDLYRQILDNAKYNGNPVKVGIGITGDQQSQINSIEPWDSVLLPVGGEGVDVDLKYLQAAPIPEYLVNMTQTLENQIDAIFGTQATFRGEFEGTQSGVSRDILRQQAGNSLAQLSRGIERMMTNLYKGWLHLILTFADDPEFVEAQIRPILGESTDEFITLLLNNNDGIEVTVKAGTILPDDKVTEQEQAIELAKMNKCTTEFLYERMGIPNPKEEAEKFDLSQTEIAIKAQKLQQEAQMRTQEQATWASEMASISSEIDALGGYDSQAPATAPPTPQP